MAKLTGNVLIPFLIIILGLFIASFIVLSNSFSISSLAIFITAGATILAMGLSVLFTESGIRDSSKESVQKLTKLIEQTESISRETRGLSLIISERIRERNSPLVEIKKEIKEHKWLFHDVFVSVHKQKCKDFKLNLTIQKWNEGSKPEEIKISDTDEWYTINVGDNGSIGRRNYLTDNGEESKIKISCNGFGDNGIKYTGEIPLRSLSENWGIIALQES